MTYTKLNAELAASLTNKDILKVYDDEEEEWETNVDGAKSYDSLKLRDGIDDW